MIPELSIVIPTFNERQNIEILLPKIEKVFSSRKIAIEILVIDDASPDGTGITALRLNEVYKNIKVIVRNDRKGIASAWHDGFSFSQGEYIVCMDADLCHDPISIITMLEKVPEFDIVIGSRYLKPGGIMKDKSLLATYASISAQSITRKILDLQAHDITHSFRLFKKTVFNKIKDKLKSNGNVFLVEFLYHAKKSGFNFTEIPIVYGKRIYGQTKLKVSKESIRFLTKILYLRYLSK